MNFQDFIREYRALRDSLPKPPTHSLDLEDTEYAAYSYRLKHCYFCFDTVDSKNCLYCYDNARTSDCVDCDYCVECELLYQSVDTYQSYNSIYLDYCARIYDSFYCQDCFDSHDLFGCVHLKQKQYCIYNTQYTKIEYEKKIKELLTLPPDVHLKKIKELEGQHPLGPSFVSHSENSDYGNQVHYCNNCYLCFDVARSENCAYMYDTFYSKSSFDLTYCYKAELCYECSDSSKIYNCDFVEWSSNCYDSSYLYNCSDCHNCFGCAGLKQKKFCILNQQYSGEEYKRVIVQLLYSRHEGDPSASSG